MKRIGLSLDSYEAGRPVPDEATAHAIASHLNRVVSRLVEADGIINVREFDLWRGMAAGSQAQGSWQNSKGSAAEIAIREVILRRLRERGIISGKAENSFQFDIDNNRVIVFADEPDIAIYKDDVPLVAVEVKGGIDQAGVLERVGAALKSLQRTRQENPASVTVLVMQDVSMTERARADLSLSADTVTHLFGTNDILENDESRELFFQILGI